jgi:hypothetical protein
MSPRHRTVLGAGVAAAATLAGCVAGPDPPAGVGAGHHPKGHDMPSAEATVTTERPDRYIKQLVSHLGHRLTTELADDGTGTIHQGEGRCVLTVQSGALRLSATAPDAEELAALQDVVTRHLLRFASQEDLDVTWTPLD